MKKVLGFLILLVLSQLAFVPVQPVRSVNTWYVSPTGSGTVCSQAAPCEIGDCVQLKAAAGDTIIAKEGIYTAPDPSAAYLLYISKSLTIIGSCKFENTGPVTCDLTQTSSILDGETDCRVIAIQGISEDGMNVYIGGFTIMRGNADRMGPSNCLSTYAGSVQGCGGGIYSENVDQLTLQNNYIWANTASDSTDPDHVSLGGGLYVDNTQNLYLSDNTFIFNYAADQGYGYGGGIFVSNSGNPNGILIKNNIFDNNELSFNRDGQGAGILSYRNSGLHLLENVFEYQNFLQKKLVSGSALFFRGTTGLTLSQNTFTDNEGDSTLAIIGDMGAISGQMDRNKFWHNPSETMIDIFGDVTLSMFNNFFGREPDITRTTKTLLYLTGSPMGGQPNLSIRHNTFAAAGYGIKVNEYSTINVDHNIFVSFSSKAQEILDPSTVTYTISENLFHWNTFNGDTGTIYFTGNPLFVDLGNGDLHLLGGSAAIDKVSYGCVFQDIDGQIRPIGMGPNNYDIGADEFMHQYFCPIMFK